jgi:general stress protein 26
MPTAKELEDKFWKALKSDMTVMLGLSGVDEGHTRPMTAQLEGEHGPIWFFTSTESALTRGLVDGARAICTFASKDHEVFATVHGTLALDNNRAVIDRLWNPFVAAWYDGKDDPKLALLRLDADQGEVWLNASSLLAGIKMLFGADPKKDYRDNAAKVDLG